MREIGRFNHIVIDQQDRACSEKAEQPGRLRAQCTAANDCDTQRFDLSARVGGLFKSAIVDRFIKFMHELKNFMCTTNREQTGCNL
jgi:hypothetical protein